MTSPETGRHEPHALAAMERALQNHGLGDVPPRYSEETGQTPVGDAAQVDTKPEVVVAPDVVEVGAGPRPLGELVARHAKVVVETAPPVKRRPRVLMR